MVKAEEIVKVSFPTAPNIDGYVLTGDMMQTFREGKQNDVPLINGMVIGDAMLFGGAPVTLSEYRKQAQDLSVQFAAQPKPSSVF